MASVVGLGIVKNVWLWYSEPEL